MNDFTNEQESKLEKFLKEKEEKKIRAKLNLSLMKENWFSERILL